MKSPTAIRRILLTVMTLPCAPLTPAAATLIPPNEMHDAVDVEVDHVDGAVISGRVINKSGHRIKDPELSFTYAWLWNNVYKPGNGYPGWAMHYVVPGELGANESTEFTFDPGRPLPARNDGRIIPSVAVTGYTQFKQLNSQALVGAAQTSGGVACP